jgi:cytochrome c biogenesis protein
MATSTKTELKVDSSTASAAKVVARPKKSILDTILKQFSSVRFGIILLVILIIMSMAGMLIMQVTVEGFDKYYATLTPATKAICTDPILNLIRSITGARLDGWNILNLFDIYRSYAFITLIGLLSINIILASIDRFPSAWKFISTKKLSASKTHVLTQTFNANLKGDGSADEPERVAALCKQFKLKPTITREEKRTTVFAERGAWNRLGAYAVHVALLTIFTGGFLTWRLAYTGSMVLAPGVTENAITVLDFGLSNQTKEFEPQQSDHKLPFDLACTDIQQTLIHKDGGLGAENTFDWFTRVNFKDGANLTPGEVHMNKPVDYRGYRFFQQSYQNTANARSIKVEIRHADGTSEVVSILKSQTAKLADGTTLKFTNFAGNRKAQKGQPPTDYNDPVALLKVQTPDGKSDDVLVFPTGPQPSADGTAAETSMINGSPAYLKEFEKVGGSHTLSVQYDPGARIVYLGFTMLAAALISVFFFQHHRVWFVFEKDEEGKPRIYAGGNTNRNRPAFEQKFNAMVSAIKPAVQ